MYYIDQRRCMFLALTPWTNGWRRGCLVEIAAGRGRARIIPGLPRHGRRRDLIQSLSSRQICFEGRGAIANTRRSNAELGVAAPVAYAIQQVGASVAWLRPLVELGAIAGITSVLLVVQLAQPRIFYRMAVDGLLPEVFTKVHSTFKTPHVTTAVTGVVAATLAGLFPIGVLSELVSIGTLLAFAIVCISVMVLRRTRPDVPRLFKTPLVPFVPIAGAILCFAQMVFLPPNTWIRLVIWLIIGLAIYFGYGYRKSRLNG